MKSRESLMMAPEDSTDYGPGGHRFNDDLLMAPESRERAEEQYPGVYHLLDHERLREAFRQRNQAANLAKKQSQAAGFWAVFLAALALTVAAVESLWGHLADPIPRVIALVSALLALVSFLIAALGLIYGKRKLRWLHARLYTERLRQFHFQTFLWRLPEIVASLGSKEARARFSTQRDQWLEQFNDEFDGGADAQLAQILRPRGMPRIWLHGDASFADEPQVPEGVDLSPVFRAYEKFRFEEQKNYAEYMLRPSNKPDSTRARRPWWLWYPGADLPLLAMRTTLRTLWIASFAVIIIIHLGITVSRAAGGHAFEDAWPHLCIVTAAFLAIAFKTLSEGLALTREIERYEEYESVVDGLRSAFQTATDSHRRVRIMMDMEKASFEEMREFLRSNYEATFIM